MKFLEDLYHIFFPRVCANCQEALQISEHVLCLKCSFQLPLTDYINEPKNNVEKAFYGRLKLEFGASLLFYAHDTITQRVIYQLKYNNGQYIGAYFGNWLGKALKESPRFPTVDCIVPVPLHPKKLRKRGYNQLTTFGEALQQHLDVPFIQNELIRKSGSQTQTRKNRMERWRNVEEIFTVKDPTVFRHKHVLLIDDVITTGATLEACAKILFESEDLKLSIVTIAFTE